MVLKVSDLLKLAQELKNDNMEFVSLTEFHDEDNFGYSVFATASKSAPEAVDYEEIYGVPGIDF